MLCQGLAQWIRRQTTVKTCRKAVIHCNLEILGCALERTHAIPRSDRSNFLLEVADDNAPQCVVVAEETGY